MLKSILSAVATAFRAVVRVAGAALSAPLKLVGGLFGGGGMAVPPSIDLPPPLEIPKKSDASVYEDIADAIMRWACDSVLADRPAPVPPGLPIATREWLTGLTRDECEGIVESDRADVLAHIRGKCPLLGVRSVQRLPRVTEWPARRSEPARDPDASSFQLIDALPMPCGP